MKVLRDPLITVEEVAGNTLRCTLRGAPERDKLRFSYHVEPGEIPGLEEALSRGWAGNAKGGPTRYRIAAQAIGYDVVERTNPVTGEVVLGATNVALLGAKLLPLSDKASPERFEKLKAMFEN